MKMRSILNCMSELSDEDFEFEFPEFTRISTNHVLEISCSDPELLGRFMHSSDDEPQITTYRRQHTYVYTDGLSATWIKSKRCYKFSLRHQKIVAVLYLQ